MSDWDDRHPFEPPDPSEGVRIIGPDEVARRNQRAPAPPDEHRGPPPDQPRWAEPAPGTAVHEEGPTMSRDPYEGDEAAAWGTPGATEPRWREDDPNRPATPPGGYPPRRSYEPPPGRSVFGEAPASSPTETYEEAYRDQSQGYDDPRYAASQTYTDQSYDDRGFDNNTRRPSPPNPRYDEGYDDNYSDDVYQEAPGRFVEPPGQPQPPPIAPRPPARPQARRTPGPPGERDMRVAIGVGVGLAVAALALFKAGPVPTMVLVIAILGVASFEYFTATQRAGFDPLMPVGVVATVGAVIAAYNYGESAILLVLVLSVAVCTVWYLVGAGGERPMANVGATLLGICWVGLFGSFAGLLLSAPNGIALLLAALVPTIGYDIGALFVGRSAGSRPLSAASPSKTVEGLVGGMVLAVVGGLVIGQIVAPFDGLTDGLKIGLVAALAAPLGDLSESLIKRDLGIKDMGSLLPGHGGVLDRFDALLFVLPAIWYLSRVTDFFLL